MIRSKQTVKKQDGEGSVRNPRVDDQLKQLKLQIQQRDNEIKVLVSMLQKKEGNR